VLRVGRRTRSFPPRPTDPGAARHPRRTQWRWCRRNPVVAGPWSGIVLAITVGFAGALVQLSQVRHEESIVRRNLYTSDMNVSIKLEGGNLQLAQELLEAHIPQSGKEDLRGLSGVTCRAVPG